MNIEIEKFRNLIDDLASFNMGLDFIIKDLINSDYKYKEGLITFCRNVDIDTISKYIEDWYRFEITKEEDLIYLQQEVASKLLEIEISKKRINYFLTEKKYSLPYKSFNLNSYNIDTDNLIQ